MAVLLPRQRWVSRAHKVAGTASEGERIWSHRKGSDITSVPSPRAELKAAGQRPVNVVWHKWSDLRILDHEPLVRAHAQGGLVLHVHPVELPLLCGSSRIGRAPRCGSRRATFWRESVEDLSKRLEDRGQRLMTCAVDSPAAFFASLCERFSVAAVFTHRDFCDEEIKVQDGVRNALSRYGTKLHEFWGGLTVHHIDDLGFDPANPAQMPKFKGEFNGVAKKRPIRQILQIPTLRPPPALHASEYGSDAVATAFTTAPLAQVLDGRQEFKWYGGESAAMEHLQWYIDSDQLKNYRGATESFAHGDEHNPINGGTRLSPWLAFGCISARTVVHTARDYERKYGKVSSGKGVGKTGSTGARLHTELLFRDFLRFSTLSWGTSLFKIGGPFQISGVQWSRDQALFQKWREGATGYPFVDAGMRELAATGYISHLHRQCCAAFLVRDLRLDWRMGAEHFEACLLDHTPDANWGNWAYRILMRPGLVESRSKYPVHEHITTMECIAWPAIHDPFLKHTLRWVPELADLPCDLAREPWRTELPPAKRVKVKPYFDSPLWFCAANRSNWDYEYFWLPGHAWTLQQERRVSSVKPSGRWGAAGFRLGRDYPLPVVPPLNLELDLGALPVNHCWGDTDPQERPHIWEGGPAAHRQTKQGKGKGKAAHRGKGKGQQR